MKPILIFSTLLFSMTLQGCMSDTTDNAIFPVLPNTSSGLLGMAAGVIAANTLKVGEIQDVSSTELQILLDKGVTLVDIRRPEEWAATGVVPGSQLLTLFDERNNINPEFATKIKQIAPTNKPVVLICRTGNRTQVAAQMLSQEGYGLVYNVHSGIHQWTREGRPVVKP